MRCQQSPAQAHPASRSIRTPTSQVFIINGSGDGAFYPGLLILKKMTHDPININCVFNEAIQLHQAGDYQKALLQYELILRHAPNHAVILRLMALAHKSLGSQVEAMHFFERSLNALFQPDVFHELARAYSENNRAVEFIERYLPQGLLLNTVHELFRIGQQLNDQQCYQGAEIVLHRAVELHPQQPQLSEQYTKALFFNGKYAEAADQYLRLLRLKGVNPEDREIIVSTPMHMRDYCNQKTSTRYICLKKESPMLLEKVVPYGVELKTEPPLIGIEPEFYIAEIDNITFVSGYNFLIGENNSTIYDLAVHPLSERYDLTMSDPFVKYATSKKLLLDLPSSTNTQAEFEYGILLSGLSCGTWAHWILEYAPCFWSLNQFPEYLHVPILADEQIFADPHVKETFEMLNGTRPVIPLQTGKRYFCKRLVVPSRLVHLPHDLKVDRVMDYHDCCISKTAVDFLRTNLNRTSSSTTRPKIRIFLPRSDSPYRRLRNEDEVQKLFEEFGFVAIQPQQLSYQEKVDTFAAAEAVAGGGGSGFMNMIFSPPGTTIISIISDTMMKHTLGSTLFKFLDLRLFTIVAPSIPGSHLLPYHRDYTVDPTLIRKLLLELWPRGK